MPGLPLPPQTSGSVHAAPHGPIVPPQPSLARPHEYPRLAQVAGVHLTIVPPSALVLLLPPQTPGPPPPQNFGSTHVAQFAVNPPQPSLCSPHVPGKLAHVFGVHAPASGFGPLPQRPAPPPPQYSPPGQVVLQFAVRPPHPSLCSPHALAG
jgi:hypothetical protein